MSMHLLDYDGVVEARLQQIAKMVRTDYPIAVAMEGLLRGDALEAIAAGHPDPVGLAKAVMNPEASTGALYWYRDSARAQEGAA